MVCWISECRNANLAVTWLPPIALAAGLLLKTARIPNSGYRPRLAVLVFLLAPVVTLHLALFNNPGWYYKGHSTSGAGAAWEQALAGLNSGLALTSLNHIKTTLAVDDHSLRQVIRLAAERPGKSVVVWEHGLVSWRKAAYYLRDVPIVVLERKKIRFGAPPVIAVWKGADLISQPQGPPHLSVTLPAGGRVVWLLTPQSEFYSLAARNFALTPAGPVYYTDLPAGRGSTILGEYKLEW